MTPEEHKYFIAIVPPPPLLEEIQALKEEIGTTYQTRGALRSPPHITLHMPFNWPDRKLKRLEDALEQFSAGQPRMEIHLRDFACFPPRVVYLSVEDNAALTTCQQQLYRYCKLHLNLFNANYQDRPFHPHITLAFRDLKKDQFHRLWDNVKERSFRSTFEAAALTLLRHDGHQWERFRDFPCAGKA